MQIAGCGIRFRPFATTIVLQRQTFTQVQIFLKFSQWHCCSIRQTFPFESWLSADAA
jgi:hypothetical protein